MEIYTLPGSPGREFSPQCTVLERVVFFNLMPGTEWPAGSQCVEVADRIFIRRSRGGDQPDHAGLLAAWPGSDGHHGAFGGGRWPVG